MGILFKLEYSKTISEPLKKPRNPQVASEMLYPSMAGVAPK